MVREMVSLTEMLMISANDLISLYVGLELQSLALYVVAAIRRDTVKSTEGFFVLKQNARVESFQPHMHLRGKAMQVEAIFPDGRTQVHGILYLGGNADGLKPERATIKTFGLSFKPASVPGLSASLDWYDIDYPEVVDLRRKVLPHFMNAHDIGADLTDPDWLGAVPGDRPASIVADGLMLFLTQEDMVSMLRRLVAHFPSGELILNAYTSYAMWTFKRSRAMAPIAGGIANPGLNNPRRLEKLVPGLALVDELLLTRTPQVAALPRGPRWAFRAAAGSALLSRLMTTVVLRYRF